MGALVHELGPYEQTGVNARPEPPSRASGMGTDGAGMTELGTDWRVVDGVASAWFDAPSLIEGAALAGRIVELSAEIVVDLRATGMRVRLDSDEHAEAVSAAGAGSRPGQRTPPCSSS